ncbi:MAG: sulfurtransferase [bacterium]|nr:sulfurtransferase [bacterium]
MKSIVSTEWLAEHLHNEDIVVADVRWVHLNSDAAHRSYLSGHIPGAVFVDVDAVLSEIGDPLRGRHPLPDPQAMVERLAALGIGKSRRVIATEEESGKVAARLWWLLKWIGVDDVAVLDGGLAKWRAESRAIETTESHKSPAPPYDVRLHDSLMLDAATVARHVAHGGKLFDARAPERFRGDVEGLDKRAGHIDGAGNIPLARLYIGDPPQLRTVEELRELFSESGVGAGDAVAAYCGSGVTACQLLWAMEYAGLQQLYLYPGSWSEWIELHPEAGRTIT